MKNSKWTSPFCSLQCEEDLVSKDFSNLSKVKKFKCQSSFNNLKIFSENHFSESSPIFDGKKVERRFAIKQLAKSLSVAKNPVFSGLGVDICGARSLIKLANKTNAILDHMDGDNLSKVTSSLQRNGLFFTTLSETKIRADLVIYLGFDNKNKKKCLINCLQNAREDKQIYHYGKNFSSSSAFIYSLQELLAYYKNKKIKTSGQNKNFLKTIQKFKYIVFAWDPSNYSEDADVISEIVLEIVRCINIKSRAGILTLSGDNGSNSMQAVMTWNTGLPLRTAFSNTELIHQPLQFSTRRIIEDKTTDLTLWVSCFENILPNFLKSLECPLIVIGHHELGKKLLDLNFENFIFYPTSTPGVDATGHLVRCDNTVITPVKKIVDSSYISLQDLINEVIELIN